MLGAIEQTRGVIADILLETQRPGETQRIASSPRWLSVKQNLQWILGISQLNRTGSGYKSKRLV